MKARIYRIVSGNVEDHYLAELASEATINNVLDVIAQAKKRFKLAGKLFILVTEDGKTFMVTKPQKKWLSYELKGPQNEVPAE